MRTLSKFLLVIFLLAVAFVAVADQRYALVVGISDYEESPLKNPTNDAADMTTALMEVGFSVQHLENVSRKEFRRAIREFSDKLSEEDIGLFYFSGHGVQVKGENFLIPIGADIQAAFEIEDEAVSVRSILGAMEESGSRLNVVILDACRNNPFRSFRGNYSLFCPCLRNNVTASNSAGTGICSGRLPTIAPQSPRRPGTRPHL